MWIQLLHNEMKHIIVNPLYANIKYNTKKKIQYSEYSLFEYQIKI